MAELGFDHAERDVFFSSKGHDVPGLYAALHGLGVGAAHAVELGLRDEDRMQQH
ncbi:MAG: hypothetical protein H0U08_02235 [Actinobacteria bacterium]|nr:hypothetical protein [Actinomycetota bacterium]